MTNLSNLTFDADGNIRSDRAFIPKGNDKFHDIIRKRDAGELTIAPYAAPTQAEIDAAQDAEVQRLADDLVNSKDDVRLMIASVAAAEHKLIVTLASLGMPAVTAALQASFPKVDGTLASWKAYHEAWMTAKRAGN